ncbi:MAG: hypothetical protein CMM55_08055 [Rhodospirillaceae bacterium]|nr:hypothetical protein [Rhodospirillaceae bacterium]
MTSAAPASRGHILFDLMSLNYINNRGHSAVSRLRKSQAQIAKTEAVANSIKRKVGDDLLAKLSSNPESPIKQAMDLC